VSNSERISPPRSKRRCPYPRQKTWKWATLNPKVAGSISSTAHSESPGCPTARIARGSSTIERSRTKSSSWALGALLMPIAAALIPLAPASDDSRIRPCRDSVTP
jgi:hypothetical protein